MKIVNAESIGAMVRANNPKYVDVKREIQSGAVSQIVTSVSDLNKKIFATLWLKNAAITVKVQFINISELTNFLTRNFAGGK